MKFGNNMHIIYMTSMFSYGFYDQWNNMPENL